MNTVHLTQKQWETRASLEAPYLEEGFTQGLQLQKEENHHHWIGHSFFGFEETSFSRKDLTLVDLSDILFYAYNSKKQNTELFFVMTQERSECSFPTPTKYWLFIPNKEEFREYEHSTKAGKTWTYYGWRFRQLFYAQLSQYYPNWSCRLCSFENAGYMPNCEICKEIRHKEACPIRKTSCSNSACLKIGSGEKNNDENKNLRCFQCDASFCSAECYLIVYETKAHNSLQCFLSSLHKGNLKIPGFVASKESLDLLNVDVKTKEKFLNNEKGLPEKENTFELVDKPLLFNEQAQMKKSSTGTENFKE